MPVGPRRFQISVIIYHGGSDSPETSNYRAPMQKRARSKAGAGTRMYGNISKVGGPCR